MEFWQGIWAAVWLILGITVLMTYLVALWSVVADLFRDHSQAGWAKALWILFFVLAPFVSVFAYVIARGTDVSLRSATALYGAKKTSKGEYQ